MKVTLLLLNYGVESGLVQKLSTSQTFDQL